VWLVTRYTAQLAFPNPRYSAQRYSRRQRQTAARLEGDSIWIADAHRDDEKRFVVRTDEMLTAFLELESAIRGCGELALDFVKTRCR
jgi:hypothetical protein